MIKKRSLEEKRNRQGWIYVSLSIVLIVLFVFYPMFQAFLTSLKSGQANDLQFVGFDNYRKMLTDATFKKAAGNTVFYLALQVPIMIVGSMIIAVFLNDKKLKFKGLFRTAIFLPSITSLVSYSIIVRSLFSVGGIINKFLMAIGVMNTPLNWISDPFWAKILIVIALTWRWTGYNMIFFLSGLQNIDPQIYEAAHVDGASKIKQFFTITVPMLKPIILFTTVTSTIGTLQLFDEVVNITGGGPANSTTTLSHYIYNLSYKFTPNFGYATAVSFAIVVAIILLSFIQLKIGGKDNNA